MDSSAETTAYKPDYYRELKNNALGEKFVNLDDNDNFAHYDGLLQAPETTNFVVDFGADGAWAAKDVNAAEVKELLARDVGELRALLYLS